MVPYVKCPKRCLRKHESASTIWLFSPFDYHTARKYVKNKFNLLNGTSRIIYLHKTTQLVQKARKIPVYTALLTAINATFQFTSLTKIPNHSHLIKKPLNYAETIIVKPFTYAKFVVYYL